MKRLFILLLVVNNFYAQAQKDTTVMPDIKTENIWIIQKKGNKEIKYRQKELRYNKDGRLIEEIIFNPQNIIIYHKALDYENGLLIRTFELDKKGNILKRTDYHYKKNTLTVTKVYDGKGELIREEEIIFEYHE